MPFAGLAQHDGSLYRSDDVGETWQRFDHGVKANATMMAAAVHPRDPARVYCVSRCGQVFGTEDAGSVVARISAAGERAGRVRSRLRVAIAAPANLFRRITPETLQRF